MYYSNNGSNYAINDGSVFVKTHRYDHVDRLRRKELVCLALSYLKCVAVIVATGMMITCFMKHTNVEGAWMAAESYASYPTRIIIEKDDSVWIDGKNEASLIQGLICRKGYTDEESYSIKAWRDKMWLDDKLYIRQ